MHGNYTCMILKTEPNELMAKIHDRMPVILPKELYKEWLNLSNQDKDQFNQC